MATRSGNVALIGKPNVGKSTLLNALVGQKVSIVSNKPQTTRRRVVGIAHGPDWEVAFLDTPGIHDPHTRLGRAMVDQARGALGDVDLVVLVVEGNRHPGEKDEELAKVVRSTAPEVPRIVVLNKMDLLKAEDVVRNVEAYTALFGTEQYMLTTATQERNLDKLMEMIVAHLPEGDFRFDPDEFTDQSSRFMVAELIRERILKKTRQEVPHSTAVRIDAWEEEDDRLRISATILVEKTSQRAILIGKGGQFVKEVGSDARQEIEQLLGRHIFLELHVKVEEGWRMSPRVLEELEYAD